MFRRERTVQGEPATRWTRDDATEAMLLPMDDATSQTSA